MADSPDDIRAWPTSPDDLADNHKCPGCFTVVSASECPVCGFVLTDPRAMQVLALGRSIMIAENGRQRIIKEVRLAHHYARVAEVAAAAVSPPPSALIDAPVVDGIESVSVPQPVAVPAPTAAPVRTPLEPWQTTRTFTPTPEPSTAMAAPPSLPGSRALRRSRARRANPARRAAN